VASVRGKYLLVSDDASSMSALLANFNREPNAKPAILIAGFHQSRERANFARFFNVIDGPSQAQADFPGSQRQPQFFSANIKSLSSTLADVAAEHIAVRTDADRVLQTVTYEWSR
jgi:hypothetical protein